MSVQTNSQTLKIRKHSCTECDREYSTLHKTRLHYYNSHLDKSSLPIQYVCKICNSKHQDKDTFTKHSTQHQLNSVQPECKLCDEKFEDENQVKSHILKNHTRALLEEGKICPVCGFPAPDGQNLYINHIRHEHSIDEVFSSNRIEGECPECGDVLSNEDGMIQHFSVKHAHDATETGYTCKICGTTKNQQNKIEKEIRNTHTEDEVDKLYIRYSCTECKTRKATTAQLKTHYEDKHKTPQIACPECNVEFNTEQQQQRHYWINHSDIKICNQELLKEIPRQKTLEYLYNINKHAKKYKQLGTENYRKGKKTTAKANSLKKDALYQIKEKVLKKILNQATSIETHTIGNSDFYFIDFDKYNFHSPIDTLSIPESKIEQHRKLDDFHSGAEKEKSDASLKESLKFFENKLGLNANNYLNRTHLSYGHDSYFIGWKYLGDDS